MAVIPQRNLIAIGSTGQVAVYDATTALRQSLTPIPQGHTPRLMQLTPSGQHLLLACAEWSVYHLPLKSVKPALLLSLAAQKKRPLDAPLMCFMPAYPSTNRVPLLFVTNRLKDSVRTAYLGKTSQAEKGAPPPAEGAKAPSKSGKELEAGAKLMLEKGKGAVALAAHPFAPVLYVLSVNGELQMYRHVHGAPGLTPLHQFTSAPPRGSPPPPASLPCRLHSFARRRTSVYRVQCCWRSRRRRRRSWRARTSPPRAAPTCRAPPWSSSSCRASRCSIS